MSKHLTHLNHEGAVHMVDVSAKTATVREAHARGTVRCAAETITAIRSEATRKGDVLAVIRIAGIQGAKKTPDLIPLAHPIAVHGVSIDLELEADAILIESHVKTADITGIEMEALTAVSCAALTAIDMVKGIDRGAFIERIELVRKSGGRSGTWTREA